MLRALLTGLIEWRTCAERGVGRTYTDPDRSNAYDQGVNLGQNLNQVGRILRRPLTQHVED